MKKIDLIIQEIKNVQKKTLSLLDKVGLEQWKISPQVINSNINWQIGHLILANYLHGVASMIGASQEFREKVDIKTFVTLYGPNSNPLEESESKPSAEELHNLFLFTQAFILRNIQGMTDEQLSQKTAVINPAVSTKDQALMWMFEHQSWHNGQLAMLIRVLNK